MSTRNPNPFTTRTDLFVVEAELYFDDEGDELYAITEPYCDLCEAAGHTYSRCEGRDDDDPYLNDPEDDWNAGYGEEGTD